MDRLWQRLTEIFGHRFTSAYGMAGEGGQSTWRKGLGDLTVQQIKAGTERCVTRVDGWPPTLPEFRALCETPTDAHAINAAAYRRNTEVLGTDGQQRLTDQRTMETRRDRARPFLQGLRAALGRGQRGSTDGEPAA